MALLHAGGVALLEDGQRPPDADNPRGYHEYEPVKRLPQQAGWLAAAGCRAVKVIHVLLPALPCGPVYRVILMRRDLREVVASQDAMLARGGASPRRMAPERLLERLAWELDATRAWLRARPEIAWMELDYNALVREPAPALARLRGFARLQASWEALAAEVRPELHRVRFAAEREAGPEPGSPPVRSRPRPLPGCEP